MQTTIKNHLEELHTSATRMLVLNSDNKMLIVLDYHKLKGHFTTH